MIRHALLLAIAAAWAVPAAPRAQEAGLRAPEEIGGTGAARSAALFEEMMLVIGHPRCLNCHPVGDAPLQDALAPHRPWAVRGPDDHGAPGMRCATCHGAANVALASGGSVPGHDPWHLAPRSMGWVGLSAGAICAQLKDPARNGGRSLEAIAEHNAHDGLVGWGWEPGPGRDPVPGTQALFGALTRAWIDTGAACPED